MIFGWQGKHSLTAPEVWRQEHRQLLHTWHEFHGARAQRKRVLAARLCRQLDLHTQLEDEFLDPLLRDVLPVTTPVDAARARRDEIRGAINKVLGLTPGDYHFDDAVADLVRRALRHFADLEAELLPATERLIDRGALVELAQQMQRRGQRLAAAASRRAQIRHHAKPFHKLAIVASVLIAGGLAAAAVPRRSP